MIEFRDLCKVYRAPDGSDVVAVDEVSLVVDQGRTLCLIGTSGCGKTTTMKMINRLIEPTRGVVLGSKAVVCRPVERVLELL